MITLTLPVFATYAAGLARSTDLADNLATFARLYPDGVKLTRLGCIRSAIKFSWGGTARELLPGELKRQYAEAVAEAEEIYTEVLADVGYAVTRGRNFMEVEAMLFADRAQRKAIMPAKREYHEVWAAAWFDNVLPELIERTYGPTLGRNIGAQAI